MNQGFELKTPSHWLRVRCGFTVDDDPHLEIFRVKQVHGPEILKLASEGGVEPSAQADGLYTFQAKLRIGVGVADCTALLVTGVEQRGPFVAALHAGWRGTAAEIIPRFFKSLQNPERLRAWLSPSICQKHFQVGIEVREAFPKEAQEFFEQDHEPGKLLFDLKGFQLKQLAQFPVQVAWSSLCTYCQPEFFSYRRETHQLSREGMSDRRKRRHIAWIELAGDE